MFQNKDIAAILVYQTNPSELPPLITANKLLAHGISNMNYLLWQMTLISPATSSNTFFCTPSEPEQAANNILSK